VCHHPTFSSSVLMSSRKYLMTYCLDFAVFTGLSELLSTQSPSSMSSSISHVFIVSVDVVTEILDDILLGLCVLDSSLKPVNTALNATPIKTIRSGLSPDFQENT